MHLMKRTSSWMFYFIINLERQKLKLLRQNKFLQCRCPAVDLDIFKWSCETTVTTKIQAQEIESEHYSYQPFKQKSCLISLENLARKQKFQSEGGEQHGAFRFSQDYTSVSLYSRYSLCSYQAAQKNLVLYKKLLCQQKKYFTQKLTLRTKLCESQKNMFWQQQKLCDTKKRLMLTKHVQCCT